MLRIGDGFRLGIGMTLAGVLLLGLTYVGMKLIERVDPTLLEIG